MDWVYLSKLIPLFLYPLNLAFLLLIMAIIFLRWRKKRTAYVLSFVSILILVISALPQTPYYLIKKLERKFPVFLVADAPEADAVLILGGAVALPQFPRQDLELVGASDRIRYAGQLYKAQKAEKIVIAGGNVFPQEGIRGEAYYIAQLLIEWGVPAEDILFEEKSRNTYQNAVFAKPLLQQNDLKSVLLVTSATHMPRAYAVFAKQEIDVIAAPTDYLITDNDNPRVFNWIPTASALSGTTWILKEYLGWWYYRFRGYI